MKKSAGSLSHTVTMGFFYAFLCISISCSKSSNSYDMGTTTPAASPAANEVFLQNMAFSPLTLSVAVGTTVTWVNKDGYAHTVTSDTNVFDSGNLNSGKSFSYTFSTAGTFPYHCSIHSSMTASVVVK